ncbi:DUF934 domain-containing protein [Exilibacterium tricleocarpae]|uniref:DUF934 domain-containing protein n=1 Tax=Exilibacterium tricleocarpae TaxID=2591008 RepID=A0A545TVN8_9GAMM|nr:DUF934 domain-containing protein [Exilibacterium tricleocarpae]TQV81289.1 DUF934 domain-containing protein [Exilibacterium tricleocarpae]
MPNLIKNGAIVTDDWTLLDADATDIPAGKVIAPLALWQARREMLEQRDHLGVWLDTDETADQLGADAQTLSLIAVNFPGFMDGRGFTTGRLLRERYGFSGELRAVGHFMRDQLCYLKRCGFTAFHFAEPVDLDAALQSLDDFTEYYQAGTDQPLPLFRRRA